MNIIDRTDAAHSLRLMNGAAMRDHLRLVELVRWRSVAQEMPDDETTVLVHAPRESDPVCLGYHDGETGWMHSDGYQIEVNYWKPLPEPPA